MEPIITDMLKSAGSMTPLAVAFWLVFQQFMHQVKEDRSELMRIRKEWQEMTERMIEAMAANAQALHELKEGLETLMRERYLK